MRHILLHGHIFKNAGSTFDWSLKRSFGEGFIDHRDDKPMRLSGSEVLRQLVQDNPDLCAISSHHMTRDFPELPGVNFIPVNLLRHPLLRIRSVYDFERKQKGVTPGARAAREKSFRDYVAWRMQPDVARTIRNYQTLYLNGCHKPVDNFAIAEQYFPQALAAISAGALLGIVERYDESMVVLEEALREYFPEIDLSYVAQNVSARANKGEDENAALSEILADMGTLAGRLLDENSFDQAIYQAACLQLDMRIRDVTAFSDKLENFRSRLQHKSKGIFSRWKSA